MAVSVGSTLFLASGVTLLIYLIKWWLGVTKKGLPPGPTPLPLVGNIVHLIKDLIKDLVKTYMELRDTYGDVFFFYSGPWQSLILMGYDAVKEALVDCSDMFGEGECMTIPGYIPKNLGIMNSNGERWKTLRGFTLMTLRHFGMGKRSMEERIQEEAQCLAEAFSEIKDSPIDPDQLLKSAAFNVICSIVFAERFDYKDERCGTLPRLYRDVLDVFGSTEVMIITLFPRLMKCIPGSHQKVYQIFGQLKQSVLDKVESHRETLDENCPRDLIDCFLVKMDEEKNNPKSDFFIENLQAVVLDLLMEGTETTSRTLRMGFLILPHRPAIQERVQAEIDAVIGRDRPPSVEDRSQMPYTDAVIHEIQRYTGIVELVWRRPTSRDATFRGYHIPKGTYVTAVLTSVLKDPKKFKNPNKFDPGNFLNEDGTFRKNEAFMPFSTGKRVCLAEDLARMEIFIFLTTILQKFTLSRTFNWKTMRVVPR